MIYLSEKELSRLGIKADSKVRKNTNKYGARKTEVDGIKFDSMAEANYYLTLKLLLRGGKIAGFCR